MAANSQFSMAVHILTLLANAEGENVKSGLIAASVNTNPVVIRRVLSQLNQAGLVASQTGAFGGTQNRTQIARILHCVQPKHERWFGCAYSRAQIIKQVVGVAIGRGGGSGDDALMRHTGQAAIERKPWCTMYRYSSVLG